MKQSNGYSLGESIMGTPVCMPGEGSGIYAPMENDNAILQRDIRKIHNRLAKKGIRPRRVEPTYPPTLEPQFDWNKFKYGV